MEQVINNLIEFINGARQEVSILLDNKILLGVLLLFFIGATFTDVKKMKIYDWFNGLFLIVRVAFIFIPVYSYKFHLTHLAGGIIGFLFLLIPAMALMHKMAGDIKFMAVLGTFLGGHLTIIFLLIACIYNLIYSVTARFILKRNKILTPFAPFFLLSFITIIVITINYV